MRAPFVQLEGPANGGSIEEQGKKEVFYLLPAY